MTATKVMDVIARLRDCDGQGSWRRICLHPDQNGRCTIIVKKNPKSECPDVWIRLPQDINGHNRRLTLKIRWFLFERNLYGLLWRRQFEEVLMELGWEKVPNLECLFVHWKKRLISSVHVDDIISKWLGRSSILLPCGRIWWRMLILTNQLHFLITYIWDERDCKPNDITVDEHRKMFESRISAGATEKWPGWETPHAKTVAWSYDMEGHAQQCYERLLRTGEQKRRSSKTKF